ncbi:C-terminal binding protein [Natronomonas gomsonensis]|uniref:C-terminal binding protein n=1 Tax=Natronomonas gomsonensis TaxID=1046043 RepID=UPI0020CA9C09|nr:C-terminal binding protein [Natronomonas gomsonensis]MCY4731563.1 C-terminal binding protein [Natronomonas gomsonensis]
MPTEKPIRVVHLDPEGFANLDTERTILQREIDSVIFDEVDSSGESIGTDVDGADILLTHYSTVPAEAIDSTGCSVIARYSTGVDGIDVAAATDRGVTVTNVPTYCDEEVGEHVIALAISLVRSLPHADAHTAAGGWQWQSLQRPRSAGDLTFGCFAFGRKAMAAADRAASLGFEVIAHDPYIDERDIREAGAEPVTFEELLERSDVLSLHAPLTDQTEGLFNADVLGRLPQNAILINTARGALVDESALVEALEDGPLSGAGLDVLTIEPPRSDNPLLDRDDTIVTPHIAWYSDRALDRVRTRGTENAIAAFRGETVNGVVNPDAFDNR